MADPRTYTLASVGRHVVTRHHGELLVSWPSPSHEGSWIEERWTCPHGHTSPAAAGRCADRAAAAAVHTRRPPAGWMRSGDDPRRRW